MQKRGKVRAASGLGRRERTRGDVDPQWQQLVAEPAGSQSEPDPGATNFPPPPGRRDQPEDVGSTLNG